MIYELRVPTSIEGNQAVRVLEWHAAAGDDVGAGQLLVEVETHKALIEIRAAQSGILRELCHAEGEWCPLGEVLARFSDAAGEPLAGSLREWAADFLIG